MTSDIVLLCFAAVQTAVFHIVVPDHWLPFVMAGRARKWSTQHLLSITGLSAAIHVSLSLCLGLVAVIFGLNVAALSGKTIATAAGGVLILFGFGWILWSRKRKGAHHRQPHAHGHKHAHPGEHVRWEHRKPDSSGIYLAAVMGLNPCVLVFPILFAASSGGIAASLAVGAVFALATIATMILVTYLAWRRYIQCRFAFLDRHADKLTGVILVVVGVYMLVWG
jgi:ABC-type nickel/cobalt efflux system permease component RcnA